MVSSNGTTLLQRIEMHATLPDCAPTLGADSAEVADEPVVTTLWAKLPKTDVGPSPEEQVYEPADDTFMLLDALHQDRELLCSPGLDARVCMEIGCGSGVVITYLAMMLGARTVCIGGDINERAIQATRRTASLNGVLGKLEVVLSDLVSACAPKSLDILVFNPPYVVSPDEEIGGCDRFGKISAAWAGGARGRLVIDRLIGVVAGVMAPGGLFYMVLEEQNVPAEVVALLRAEGLTGEETIRRTVDHEEAPEQLYVYRFRKAGHAAPELLPQLEPEPAPDPDPEHA